MHRRREREVGGGGEGKGREAISFVIDLCFVIPGSDFICVRVSLSGVRGAIGATSILRDAALRFSKRKSTEI